ncbi:winged helix-turn-helix domain-containing protein, partial [Kineococcus glutinatus]|uniref:winged helix-turn-helix domain-containing protein n=1 Tax=Kineococcus glutinatus TaxID=1070872 RepID=UPI0031EAE660
MATALRRRAAVLRPGDKLPSSRALIAELGVGPVTVQRALDQLVADGTVQTRPGAGTFVARPTTTATTDTAWQRVALGDSPVHTAGVERLLSPPPAGALPMATGYLDPGLLPSARLAAALAGAARRLDGV